MFYLYFSLFNKNIHKVKNIAIRIVSCHTYRDTYRIVKMCIVTSLLLTVCFKCFIFCGVVQNSLALKSFKLSRCFFCISDFEHEISDNVFLSNCFLGVTASPLRRTWLDGCAEMPDHQCRWNWFWAGWSYGK